MESGLRGGREDSAIVMNEVKAAKDVSKESAAGIERNQTLDERVGKVEENLKTLATITYDNRGSLATAVVDHKKQTEEHKTDREGIASRSSNLTTLQAQVIAAATLKSMERAESDADENQQIADRLAKIGQKIVKHSSTLQILRSAQDSFIAQHGQDSERSKAG